MTPLRRSLFLTGVFTATFFALAPSLSVAKSELDWSLGHGTNSVGGRLAIRMPDDSIRVHGGDTVLLLPYTTQTRLFLNASASEVGQRKPGAAADDPALGTDLAKYARRERTRQDGTFLFDRLPAGTWIVRGRINVSFARVVEITVPTVVTVDGQQITGAEARRATVFDYTFAWFDSKPVSVRNGSYRPVEFHLVARQDRTNPQR